MATLEAELLFQIDMKITSAEPIGAGPHGTRTIAYVRGTFEGPELKGTVENGADWFLLRPDGVGELDVRLSLKTQEGEWIYMHYTGLAHIPEEARAKASPGQLPEGSFSLRTAVRFETASPKHDRLNRIQAIGIGSSDTKAGMVSYKIYALA